MPKFPLKNNQSKTLSQTGSKSFFKSLSKGNKGKINNNSIIRFFVLIGLLSIVLIIVMAIVFPTTVENGNPQFRDKEDTGFYIFRQLLGKLDYSVKESAEKKKLPKKPSVFLYTKKIEGEWVLLSNNKNESGISKKNLNEWITKGNDLILIGPEVIDQFFGQKTTFSDNLLKPISFNTLDLPKKTILVSPYRASVYFLPEFIKDIPSNKKSVLAKNKEDKPAVVLIKKGEGTLLLIADDKLFRNSNLKNLSYAYLTDALFAPYKEKKIYLIRKSMKSVPTPSTGTFLFSGRHTAIVVHVIIMFALFLFLTGKRFAPPEILSGKKQRESIEHTRAVGMFYQNNQAWSLIEKIDSEYFKTIICQNKKPGEITPKEYEEYTSQKENLMVSNVIQRFKERSQLHLRKERRKHFNSKETKETGTSRNKLKEKV